MSNIEGKVDVKVPWQSTAEGFDRGAHRAPIDHRQISNNNINNTNTTGKDPPIIFDLDYELKNIGLWAVPLPVATAAMSRNFVMESKSRPTPNAVGHLNLQQGLITSVPKTETRTIGLQTSPRLWYPDATNTTENKETSPRFKWNPNAAIRNESIESTPRRNWAPTITVYKGGMQTISGGKYWTPRTRSRRGSRESSPVRNQRDRTRSRESSVERSWNHNLPTRTGSRESSPARNWTDRTVKRESSPARNWTDRTVKRESSPARNWTDRKVNRETSPKRNWPRSTQNHRPVPTTQSRSHSGLPRWAQPQTKTGPSSIHSHGHPRMIETRAGGERTTRNPRLAGSIHRSSSEDRHSLMKGSGMTAPKRSLSGRPSISMSKSKKPGDPASKRRQAYTTTTARASLRQAIIERDMQRLESVLTAVARDENLSREMDEELHEARQLLERLTILRNAKNSLQEMKQTTSMSTLLSLRPAHPIQTTVMKAVLVALGVPECEVQDWPSIEEVLGNTKESHDSFLDYLLGVNTGTLEPYCISRAKHTLGRTHLNVDRVKFICPMLVPFYLWLTTFIDDAPNLP